MRRSASSGRPRRRRRLRAARPGLSRRLDDQPRQPLAPAAVEPVGLRIFVDQPLELPRVAVETGAGQRRRQMADRHGGDPALGLRGFARIADDEGIDHRQRAGDDFGKAGRCQRHRLAGQPFQRAMGADMDERMACRDLLQPQAEGHQGVARRQRRIVVVGAAVGGPAAIGGERHGDVAEARGAEAEGVTRFARTPLSCRTSPPQGGIAQLTWIANLKLYDGEAGNEANLPPCGGDVRQDRGGRIDVSCSSAFPQAASTAHARPGISAENAIVLERSPCPLQHVEQRARRLGNPFHRVAVFLQVVQHGQHAGGHVEADRIAGTAGRRDSPGSGWPASFRARRALQAEKRRDAVATCATRSGSGRLAKARKAECRIAFAFALEGR